MHTATAAWRISASDVATAAAVANALALVVFLAVVVARLDPQRDLIAYFQVLERVHARGPIYDTLPAPGPQTQAFPYYLYPPFFAAALRLVPRVSWPVFARSWTLLVAVGFVGYALALARIARERVSLRTAGLALLLLTWWPGALTAVALGQVDPILWAMVGLGLCWTRGRGAAFAAVALVKPFTVVGLVAAVVRERALVLLSALLVVAAGLLLGVLAFGPAGFTGACLQWFNHVLPALGQGSWAASNVSLSFAPLRVARRLGWLGDGVLPGATSGYLAAVGVLGPAVVAWALRARAHVLQYAATIAAAVLLAPICWTTYLPLLLAPGAAVLGAPTHNAGEPRA